MVKLLVVVTRMSVIRCKCNGQCGCQDEYTKLFDRPSKEEHYLIDWSEDKRVLLVHGYFGKFDTDNVMETAQQLAKEIQEAVGSLNFQEMEIRMHTPSRFDIQKFKQAIGQSFPNISIGAQEYGGARPNYQLIEDLAQEVRNHAQS